MTLQRQPVNMPFGHGGIDTKTNPIQIPLGKLLVLENATFVSPGKLSKRNGYLALTTSILGGGMITAGQTLFSRLNELCLIGTAPVQIGALTVPTPNSLLSYD